MFEVRVELWIWFEIGVRFDFRSNMSELHVLDFKFEFNFSKFGIKLEIKEAIVLLFLFIYMNKEH